MRTGRDQLETLLLEKAVIIPIQHVRWIITRNERGPGMTYHNIHSIDNMTDTYIEGSNILSQRPAPPAP